MDAWESLAALTQDEGAITEVIRPAAVLPEEAARAVLMQLALRDVRLGGVWDTEPALWRRYDTSWVAGHDQDTSAQLLGSIQVAYGVPTRYEITIFRATVTRAGSEQGWTVESLCDDALQYGALTLASCPRADLKPPPKPFRFEGVGRF
ncbi:MAG: hypothetical protein JO079_12465 [Frankiaceae bacterium]|nr:hypothetical protein [Frankiaceae bacterium]MBV9369100.1 hypothetical protein [Frankiales bacterium]